MVFHHVSPDGMFIEHLDKGVAHCLLLCTQSLTHIHIIMSTQVLYDQLRVCILLTIQHNVGHLACGLGEPGCLDQLVRNQVRVKYVLTCMF